MGGGVPQTVPHTSQIPPNQTIPPIREDRSSMPNASKHWKRLRRLAQALPVVFAASRQISKGKIYIISYELYSY